MNPLPGIKGCLHSCFYSWHRQSCPVNNEQSTWMKQRVMRAKYFDSNSIFMIFYKISILSGTMKSSVECAFFFKINEIFFKGREEANKSLNGLEIFVLTCFDQVRMIESNVWWENLIQKLRASSECFVIRLTFNEDLNEKAFFYLLSRILFNRLFLPLNLDSYLDLSHWDRALVISRFGWWSLKIKKILNICVIWILWL